MKFRILVSYHYFKQPDFEPLYRKWFPHGNVEIFADCGAFSAFTQGVTIDVHEYGRWLKRNSRFFAVYANLDAIGDDASSAARTLENQKILEDMGLRPLPVFHVGEPFEALEHYLDNGYRYIALGGLVGRENPMPWLIKCFRMAKGQAVFHGFGMTTWNIITALPFYSVDSSSWGSGYRYGNVVIFDPKRHRFVTAKLGKHETIYKGATAQLIRQYGFDPADFADRSRNSRELICQLSVLSWMEAEKWLRARHGPIEIPDKNEKGLRWYCADGSVQNLADAASGLSIYLAESSTDLHKVMGSMQDKELA